VAAPTTEGNDELGQHRRARRARVEALGGTYREVVGSDVAEALVAFATAEHATQLVLGTSATRRRRALRRRSVVDRVVGTAPSVDVHVVSVPGPAPDGAPRRVPGSVAAGRQLLGGAVGAVLLAVLTATLAANRGELSVATSLGLYLLAVVATTAIGGAIPGLVAAVVAPLLANWFLIPPYHTFRVSDGDNLLELLVFVSVAAIVSWFVSIAARRALEAQRAQREAATLATLTGSGNLELPEVIVEQLRRTFHLDGVAVLGGGDRPEVLATTGDAPASEREADLVAPLASGYVVAARGRPLSVDDERVLRAFLGQLSRAFEQQRLRQLASEADALAKADELRTAMLRAVSHDLRSPLANIKASVSTLRQPDVEWPTEVRDDFLESIETETDRLGRVITNLLDMSRLEAGVLRPVLRSVTLEEVVPAALHGLGDRAARVVVDLPADPADVQTDPALLERVVANLVGNALTWSPDAPVKVRAHRSGRTVQLHVIDHGPGIPVDQRVVVLQPFHRLDDTGTGGGLGLGLAIADRLVAAMGGTLELRDTPGGGLTVVVALPASPVPAPASELAPASGAVAPVVPVAPVAASDPGTST
jgi:two-component system sensor histidine kinase KdpD